MRKFKASLCCYGGKDLQDIYDAIGNRSSLKMNLLINFSRDRSKKLKDVGLRTLIEKRRSSCIQLLY